MYRTYSTNEEKPVYPYEERLIPKDVNIAQAPEEEEKQTEVKTDGLAGGLFPNVAADDVVIVGLLFFLLYEDCNDWLLIVALIALLFLR